MGDTLTFSLTIRPAGMTINSTTGLINWTPTATGDYDVTVEVSDNGSPVKSITQSFTITVEDGEVTPGLKVTPPTQSVIVGNQATIDVVVENVTALKGASITLNFDATKLQYASSTDGGFIPSAFLAPATVDNVNGSVTLDIAGLAGPVSGTGTIITVKFDTIATTNPPTNITFGTTELRDKDNNPITHTKGSGCSLTIN